MSLLHSTRPRRSGGHDHHRRRRATKAQRQAKRVRPAPAHTRRPHTPLLEERPRLTLGTIFAALAAVLVAALLLAPPAFAAQAVQLRADAQLRGGAVTLGDLFENAGQAAPVIVASGVPGSSVVLDAGRLQSLAAQNGLLWSNPQGLRRVIARAGAGPAPAAGPARAARVLAYARDIDTGEVVRAEDLAWSQTAVASPIGAPRDSDAVIGMAARRPLRAGAAVSLRDVSAPQVIRKDDVISVAYEAGGVRLVLQGKAMGPAATGEAFSVVNPLSKKVIQAVAIGPGEAIVGPEAERFKAAARADPRLVASLR